MTKYEGGCAAWTATGQGHLGMAARKSLFGGGIPKI